MYAPFTDYPLRDRSTLHIELQRRVLSTYFDSFLPPNARRFTIKALPEARLVLLNLGICNVL